MPDVAGKIPFLPMNKAVHKLNRERPATAETEAAKVMEKKAVERPWTFRLR
jgi:hypothetical protein